MVGVPVVLYLLCNPTRARLRRYAWGWGWLAFAALALPWPILVARRFPATTHASSTKGFTGHTLGAAGIVEAVISLLALRHGLLPGGLNVRERDPALGVNYLQANRTQAVRHVLTNSFGFGGSNASLVLGAT